MVILINPIPLKFLLVRLVSVPKTEAKYADPTREDVIKFKVDSFDAALYSNKNAKNDKLIVFV